MYTEYFTSQQETTPQETPPRQSPPSRRAAPKRRRRRNTQRKILLLATGCALAEARDTLVWAMSAEPASLDPMNTASMNTFTITYALYDCLTIADGNGGSRQSDDGGVSYGNDAQREK